MNVIILGLIVWMAITASSGRGKKPTEPEANKPVAAQEVNKKTEATQDSYFLQVNAFAKEEEANQLKTDLALRGFQAIIQTAEIPNRGTIHRVRIGPMSDIETIYRVNDELQANGFNPDLIKVNGEASNQ